MFKVGDRVRLKDISGFHHKGELAIIKEVDESNHNPYLLCFPDMQTGKYNATELELIKEDTMRERIERLQGWNKEADDLLQELKQKNYELVIIDQRDSSGHIHLYTDSRIVYKWDGRDADKSFYYGSGAQCEKLAAFKQALLWLAEKAGKLKDPKLKEELAQLRHESVELNRKIKELEGKL